MNETNNEIKMLERAVELATNARYFRFESFSKALEVVKFPYRLVQSWEIGRRGNLYFWTGNWAEGSVYIQETRAGKNRVHGILPAIKMIRDVLKEYAA